MTITVDLYKELELDRSWDEKTIKNHLKSLQKLWTQRQGACNDKEQLLLIDAILKNIEDGYRYLIKEIKRKQYDKALDEAYKNGTIADKTEEKLLGILDQAKAYYRKGNIQLATKFAVEAVEGKINDPAAYDLLARCYYDVDKNEKALEVIDQGIGIFEDNLNLHWLGARIATHGMKNYEDAQHRINVLLEKAPDSAIGHSEQVYLHLRKGEEELAFQEIDTYIEKHPGDENFKRGVAYDLNAYAYTFYYHDEAQDVSFIADKESYEKCLKLSTKAEGIYSDEYTRKRLENAKYFGKKEWNDWNMESIKTLTVYGAILLLLYWPIGLALLAVDAALVYFSFRPYWQINKSYITGKMGTTEKVISIIGDYSARFSVWFVQFIIKMVGWLLKFILQICSGGFFR